MKTSRIMILTLALCLMSATSFAASPHPTAVDADGDGAWTATVDINGDTKVDHLDIGIKAKDLDCDDAQAAKSPLLTEVVGDGIDNDCDGTDLQYPASLGTGTVLDGNLARLKANEYSGRTFTPNRLILELARCAAATQCEVDLVQGDIRITAASADDYVWGEAYLGTTKVIATDGDFEIVEAVAWANAQHILGEKAEKKAAAAKPVYRGPSKATRQAEATEVATAIVEGEAEKRLEGDIELGHRIDDVETANETRDGLMNDLFAADDVLTDAVVDEAEAREEADRIERSERIQADGELAAEIEDQRIAREAAEYRLQQEQTRQRSTVADLSTSGFAINGGVIGGVQLQRELTANGDTLRGPAMGNVGFDMTVHLDLDDALIGGFGSAMWGSDGSGSGADEAYILGFEALGDIQDSGHHLGGFAGYRHTEGHSNLLDVNVPADGACGGVSYRYQAPSAGHVTVSPFARLGVCGEVYGSKGWQDGADGDLNLVVTRGQGIGATALVGVSFSATSVLDR